MSNNGNSGIVEAVFPETEDTAGVLPLFRQLYSRSKSDNLLHRTSRIYNRHVSDDRKRIWLEQMLKFFDHMLAVPPFVLQGTAYSTCDFLDIFLYGTRLLHAKSNRDSETKFAQLVGQFGREKVVMAAHSALGHLYHNAHRVYLVIRQDYAHWIRDLGYTGPDRGVASDLLASRWADD